MRAFAMLAGLLLPVVAGIAHEQRPYAVFSPAIIEQLPSQRDSAPARAIVEEADRFVTRNPNALARVHTKGTLSGDPEREKSRAAEKDWPGMLALGLAYRITGERKYLDADGRFLAAWAGVYVASMNPIDETHLSEVLLAWDLVRGDVPRETDDAVQKLATQMATGYLDDLEAKHSAALNLYSHRVKLATMAAFATGDAALEKRAETAFGQHIERNIRKDGSVEDFYHRDALYYVTYDVEPLEMAALAAQSHGQDWFRAGKSGRTVQHAVQWLVPYALGQKTHKEFVHSEEPFDKKRRDHGESGFSGMWDPAKGAETLAIASLMDAQFAGPFAVCAQNTGRPPAAWVALIAAIKR